MQEEIGFLKKTNSDMEEENNRKNFMSQVREDHSNCMSLEKHKSKINEILSMSKDATQREMTAKLENVKLQNNNA